MPRTRRYLGLTLVLLAACDGTGTRGLGSGSGGSDALPRFDAAAASDATPSDATPSDTSTVDAGAMDAGTADSQVADASLVDTAVGDATIADAVAQDSGMPPQVSIRVRATTVTFAHSDNLSGQTALLTMGSVRSLSLLTSPNDANPVVLFDHGATGVEVSYDHGGDTIVGQRPHSALTPGRYTIARMVQNWSRYRVNARWHDLSGSHDGELENLIVMSDGSDLNGTIRDGGYYESMFMSSTANNTTSGSNFIVPVFSTTAGARAVVEGGVWAVYFPIDVEIPAAPAADYEVDCLVNMYEAFRWTDIIGIGHGSDVFDFGATYWEPVLRFGGNDFELTIR